MAASTSRKSPGNHKVLLAALLYIAAAAAAAFLPGSSASTPLVTQTCGRTSNPRVCVSLLESSNRSRSATTVQELAVVAVTAARRSVLRARIGAWGLSDGGGARGGTAKTPTPADRVVARCAELYTECLNAAAHALARVKYMRVYDARVADAVAALRAFPVKCQGAFDAQDIASPLALVNRDTEQKLRIATEIVRLLRQSPPSPESRPVSLAHGDVEVERTNV